MEEETETQDSTLNEIVFQIERLESEKSEISEAIKEAKAEAKARGYDTKALASVLARRKRDRDDVLEEDVTIDLYEEALGM